MPDIDWSKAPEGATHHLGGGQPLPWRKFDPTGDYWHDGARWKAFIRDPEFPYIAKPEAHADDLAVDAFAQAMVRRLAQCRAAGRSGWDDPEQCPPQRLAEGLVRAVRAGKLVDVGNYAMMLWKRTYGRELPPSAPIAGWIGEALERQGTPSLSDFIVIQPKAEPVEWDGTGLPPMGTYVEVHRKGRNPGEGMVVAEHLGEPVVWLGNNDYARMSVDWLHPILTPEQRAAKERDKAVAAMLMDMAPDSEVSMRDAAAARALYAAGWRKTEGE